MRRNAAEAQHALMDRIASARQASGRANWGEEEIIIVWYVVEFQRSFFFFVNVEFSFSDTTSAVLHLLQPTFPLPRSLLRGLLHLLPRHLRKRSRSKRSQRKTRDQVQLSERRQRGLRTLSLYLSLSLTGSPFDASRSVLFLLIHSAFCSVPPQSARGDACGNESENRVAEAGSGAETGT